MKAAKDGLDELALYGGTPVRSAPWPPRANIGIEEKDAVVALFDRAIQSGASIIYEGEEEQAYCREFAEFHGGGFADAVNSGSTALYVALRALEIEPFTEVIVPPVTDPGGMMAVPLLNCIPVPADSEPNSFNMGARQISERITDRTSAIVVAHISGAPADMDPIMELAAKNGLPVIEDCAQAHGATYKSRYVGTIGDIGVFSTMHSKHHVTGSIGGVVFTKNEARYWKVREYSDRGKPRIGEIDWRVMENVNVACSLNFNLGDLGASIGRPQLRKLASKVARRQAFVARLAEDCKAVGVVSVNDGLPHARSAYWFVLLHVALEQLDVDKDTFCAALVAEGLPIASDNLSLFTRAPWYRTRAVFGRSGYPWTSPAYRGDPDQEYPVPNAVATNDRHCRLEIHENLSDQERHDVVAALSKVIAIFSKKK